MFRFAPLLLVAACAHSGPPAASDSSKNDLAKLQARRLSTACQQYAQEKGSMPASLNDLIPGYLEVIPKDSWGNDFALAASSCEVRSNGPDGVAGTADDISSAGQLPTAFTK